MYGSPSWWEEARLLDQLSADQEELVGEILTRAAHSEAVSEENAHLAQELAGNLDRVQEIHHRVRNHLQAVTGLLSAQEASEASPTARRALRESAARLASIAAIHELLARDPRSGELRLPDLTERLAQHLLAQAGAADRVQIRAEVAPVTLGDREATAFVLILTELLSNSIEHGLPGQMEGEIAVCIEDHGSEVSLLVKDSGCGLPPGFDLAEVEGLGLRLVVRLAERDLRGTVAAWNEGGACLRIRFPVCQGAENSVGD